jgi:hypothetical protein
VEAFKLVVAIPVFVDETIDQVYQNEVVDYNVAEAIVAPQLDFEQFVGVDEVSLIVVITQFHNDYMSV